MQAESSKFSSLSFDYELQIVIHLKEIKKYIQKAPSNRTENVGHLPNELLKFKNSFFIK